MDADSAISPFSNVATNMDSRLPLTHISKGHIKINMDVAINPFLKGRNKIWRVP